MKMKTLNLARVALAASLLLLLGQHWSYGQLQTIEGCQIQAVDRTNMTITVKQLRNGEVLTLYVTSQTRLFRNGEPAVTSDLQIGDIGGGSVRANADNRLEAVRFYVRGAKPDKYETNDLVSIVGDFEEK